MRHWGRAQRPLQCGSCIRRSIAVGEAVSYWETISGGAWTRIRCTDCAGAAPPDLPAEIVTRAPDTSTMTRIGDAAPKRTRGALREAVREWLPYSERE